MEILVDMNLSPRWVDVLNDAGHEARHWTEIGNPRAPDSDLIAVLPFTFAAAVGRTLVSQKAAGLPGFAENGFGAMVSWLVDLEELDDAMCA
jgi:hypothetical protein